MLHFFSEATVIRIQGHLPSINRIPVILADRAEEENKDFY